MRVDKYSCGTLPWIQVDQEDLAHLNFPVGKKNWRKLRLATKTRMNNEIVRPTESDCHLSITALQHKNPTVLESISPLAIYIALFFRSTPRRNMIGFFPRGQSSRTFIEISNCSEYVGGIKHYTREKLYNFGQNARELFPHFTRQHFMCDALFHVVGDKPRPQDAK